MGIEAKLVTVKLVRTFLNQSVDIIVSEQKKYSEHDWYFLRKAMNSSMEKEGLRIALYSLTYEIRH